MAVFCFTGSATAAPLSEDSLGNVRREWTANGNPLFRHEHTCDPAVMVCGDTLWLFAGRDAAGNKPGYHINEWLAFSTTDLKHWTEWPVPLRIGDFRWARPNNAFAGHVAEHDGRYYWFVSTNATGIGVAVADRPEGPYKDMLGRPLLTKRDCRGASHGWVCIDPAVFTDDDGRTYLFWGNRFCYWALLKESMTEIDGEIHRIDEGLGSPELFFTEAPWVFKRGGRYYMLYAAGWPEKIAYSVADRIEGPWEYKGVISEIAGNSNTTHPAAVEFKGRWIFFTHNGALPDGGSGSRSVVAEWMNFNADGSIQPIPPTAKGIN